MLVQDHEAAIAAYNKAVRAYIAAGNHESAAQASKKVAEIFTSVGKEDAALSYSNVAEGFMRGGREIDVAMVQFNTT